LGITPNGNNTLIKVAYYQAGVQIGTPKNYALGYNPSAAFNNLSIVRNETNAYIIYGNGASPIATVYTSISAGGVFGVGFSPQLGAPSHADSVSISSISFTAPTFNNGACARDDTGEM